MKIYCISYLALQKKLTHMVKSFLLVKNIISKDSSDLHENSYNQIWATDLEEK